MKFSKQGLHNVKWVPSSDFYRQVEWKPNPHCVSVCVFSVFIPVKKTEQSFWDHVVEEHIFMDFALTVFCFLLLVPSTQKVLF